MRKRFIGLNNFPLIAFLLGGVLAIAALPASASQSVTLAWNPSTNANVAGYNIYYGAATGIYTNVVSVGNVTNAAVSGLLEGVTYYFAAKTVNQSGMESDFSSEASYTIPFPPPTLNVISNVVFNENAAAQTVNLTGVGGSDGIHALTVGAVSGNPALVPNPTVIYASPDSTGALICQPVANASGTATITVTVNNGQPQNNTVTRSFTVTVNAVNQPPTMNPISNITINENAGAQTLQLTGISPGTISGTQKLTISAASSNTKLINAPAVSYISPNTTGQLTLIPVHNASGAVTITVILNNGGTNNNISEQTFSVAIMASANPPKITAQPTNTTAAAGQAATFRVNATGTALVYQWQYNAVNLPNATNAVLTLANVGPNAAGLYSVNIANSGGQTVSQPASLAVYDATAATLDSAVHTSSGFSFTVNGVTGYKYAVQASTNMVDWISVQTNTAPYVFVDSNAAQFNQRFYRTAYVP